MAGSIGGFNAHAANIVAAIYIACGQVMDLCYLQETLFTFMVVIRVVLPDQLSDISV